VLRRPIEITALTRHNPVCVTLGADGFTLIKDKSVAQQISELMLEYSERINESIRLVQDKCSLEEFKTYRLAAAKVMGEMFLEVMNPLYREHPDLKPEGLD